MNRSALSITSFGTPSSWWIHAASSMYGAIVRLVMKPGTSLRHTTDFFFRARAIASASRSVFGLVSSPLTISTSGIRTAGLKKCIPTTRSGRFVARPIAVMLSPLVFDARIARGGASASSSAKSFFFSSRSSSTASMTRPAPSTASRRSRVGRICPTAASAWAEVICWLSTSLLRDQRIRSIPRSRNSSLMSRIVTVNPLRAASSASPCPISPAPITAIFVGGSPGVRMGGGGIKDARPREISEGLEHDQPLEDRDLRDAEGSGKLRSIGP